jgi:CXXX repeat modification system protein
MLNKNHNSIHHLKRGEEMNEAKVLLKLSKDEKEEIYNIFIRKTALAELLSGYSNLKTSGVDVNELYERVLKDMDATMEQYNLWFEAKKAQYKWETRQGYKYSINFINNEVLLEPV